MNNEFNEETGMVEKKQQPDQFDVLIEAETLALILKSFKYLVNNESQIRVSFKTQLTIL